MIIIPLLMLLVPGLIALRIHWHGREINKAVYKYLVCDYLIYSFLIIVFNYAFMYVTYRYRTVSFSLRQQPVTESHIYTASFVFKYSVMALFLAVVLPLAYRCGRRLFEAICKNLGIISWIDSPDTERKARRRKRFEDQPLS